MSASWELVAHILSAEDVADNELALRLDCPPLFVARVRADLGLPAFPTRTPVLRIPAPVTPEHLARWKEYAKHTEGGHRRWTGRHDNGQPLFQSGVTAGRMAFRIEHAAMPVGIVLVECEVPHCVAGAHLSDQVMRDQAAAAAALAAAGRPGPP